MLLTENQATATPTRLATSRHLFLQVAKSLRKGLKIGFVQLFGLSFSVWGVACVASLHSSALCRVIEKRFLLSRGSHSWKESTPLNLAGYSSCQVPGAGGS